MFFFSTSSWRVLIVSPLFPTGRQGGGAGGGRAGEGREEARALMNGGKRRNGRQRPSPRRLLCSRVRHPTTLDGRCAHRRTTHLPGFFLSHLPSFFFVCRHPTSGRSVLDVYRVLPSFFLLVSRPLFGCCEPATRRYLVLPTRYKSTRRRSLPSFLILFT